MNSGLRAAQFIVDFYIIFEFLYRSIEVLNDVSAGGQPVETRLVFKTSKVCLCPSGYKRVREDLARVKVGSPKGRTI